MSGSKQAVMMAARNLPEAEQGHALEHLQAHFTVDDLILMAWNDDTPGVLRALSKHGSVAVRTTVARNSEAPTDVLEALATDANSKVAATAKRNLMWYALEKEETEVPPYSVEVAGEVYALVNDRRWNDHVPLGPALTRLLQNPEWNQNPHVIRNFYDEGDLKDPALIQAVGANNLIRTLIPALEDSQKAEALQHIAAAVTAEELLCAIHENEALLMPLARRKRQEDMDCGCDCNSEDDQEYYEDGEGWSSGSNEGPDPLEWLRTGSAHCPDEVLLAALSPDSKSELSEGLAIANIRTRPHLQGVITRMITDRWANESGLWLAEALSDEALLDLPFRILAEDGVYVEPDDAVQRARKQFTAELSTITAKRPEAWQTLFVLSNDYHGSAREMLAALRNL